MTCSSSGAAPCDEFFSSVHGPSFPNHLYTIAAQAGGAKDNPIFAPLSVGPRGCDSPSATRVSVIINGRKLLVPPCFDFKTLADSLNDTGLSWRYYGVPYRTPGYIWSAFDVIKHVRMGPRWTTNVVDNSQFATDAAAGDLPSASWITTDFDGSEHPAQPPCVRIRLSHSSTPSCSHPSGTRQ
jgi:phospholipase C